MGALMLAFMGVLLGSLPVLSRNLVEAFRVKFENAELVERLSRANRELSERVAEHARTEEALRQTSRKYEALIDASPIPITARDENLNIIKWNAAAERTFGWSEREVLGGPAPFVPPELEDEARALRAQLLRGEPVADLETVRLRKDGTRIHVNTSTTILRDASGKVTGYFSLITDITERRRAEQRRNLETQLVRLLAEGRSAEEVMPRVLQLLCEVLGYAYGARWYVPRGQQMMRCAESWCAPEPRFEAFRQYAAGRIQTPGGSGGLIRRVWATTAPVWLADLEQEGALRRTEEIRRAGLRSAFAVPILVGEEFYGVMEFFATEPRPRDERVVEIVQAAGVQIGQFIARKQAESNLQFFASHDPLTGLFNRSMFNERLQQALAQAVRFERSLALLFVDLDGFKQVNDTFGHNAGDAMLAELAARLRAGLREGDVVGRMGGDEFVVLIEEFDEASQVAEVAKKVIDAATRPFVLHGRECRVTASVGIGIYPDDGKDAQALLKSADTAMYLVKQQGKNGFRFYSPQMNVHLLERQSLESGLRRALERGELTMLYQPRVGVRGGEVSGVEALMRWRHPAQGVIGPGEFVPVAEDAGLIAAIGEWALHTACRQARDWTGQGLPALRVAVNLSPKQFLQESLIQVVREALHDTRLDPARLELEITEEMVIRNPERATRLLGQFRDLGVKVVIDDFGTGFSSLNLLQRLPIDSVKIDRTLVLGLPGDGGCAALARAVVAMAHSLGISVTAEGVETREQREFLEQAGCDEMQGNHFSAPVDPDLIAGMLRQPAAPGRRASVQSLQAWRGGSGGETTSTD